jgi:hypothetical protein
MVFIRINLTLWTVVLDTVGISIPKTFKASQIQTWGMGFRKEFFY